LILLTSDDSPGMFERILKRVREKIRAQQFVVTLHTIEELEDEGLSVLDVERAILITQNR
jgi:hypothetical protein